MSKQQTETRWRERVHKWKSSGLTCKQFAAREGLNAGTLAYWKKELNKRDRAAAASTIEPLAFVEVAAPMTITNLPHFEVELPTGMRLRVPSSFDASTLRCLLDVLEKRS